MRLIFSRLTDGVLKLHIIMVIVLDPIIPHILKVFPQYRILPILLLCCSAQLYCCGILMSLVFARCEQQSH